MSQVPKQHLHIKQQFPEYFSALESLGRAVKASGPLDEKTCQLIQLAGASAIRSEGAVHSHTRRALEAGATAEEIYQAILLITSTVGFPTASAALSWADDVIKGK